MKRVWWIVVLSLLSLNTFAVMPGRSTYVGSCLDGELRCAGISVQKCLNGRWFIDKVCSFGTLCNAEAKMCTSKERGQAVSTFSSLVKLPPCQDGQAVCERAHVLMYCNNKKWQRETCKLGFRCNSRRAGCEPARPFMGIKYSPSVEKTSVFWPGKSKYQPPSIKRYTHIRS